MSRRVILKCRITYRAWSGLLIFFIFELYMTSLHALKLVIFINFTREDYGKFVR